MDRFRRRIEVQSGDAAQEKGRKKNGGTAQLALRTKWSVPTSTIASRKCETRILLCSDSDTGGLRSSSAWARRRTGAALRVRAAGNSSSTERRTVPLRVGGGGTSAIRAAILA